MGSSPSATLFYGYYWHTDGQREAIEDAMNHNGPGEDWYGWQGMLAKRAGHVDPWASYPSGMDRAAGLAWCTENRAALDAWNELTAQFGGEVDVNSHSEYDTCYYLHANASKTCASDWSGRAVNPATMVVDPAWRVMLDCWLETFGLQAPQPEPGWWLVPDYG
jgi:hypothetical protein